ncbi:MAG: hypothetical protein JNK20_17805 [Flavipsychrobacter sp.]|nr:hypothetical protein [Flavipsychrobacter sp.]
MENNFLKPLVLACSSFLLISTASFAQVSVGPEAGFTASGLYDQDANT